MLEIAGENGGKWKMLDVRTDAPMKGKRALFKLSRKSWKKESFAAVLEERQALSNLFTLQRGNAEEMQTLHCLPFCAKEN